MRRGGAGGVISVSKAVIGDTGLEGVLLLWIMDVGRVDVGRRDREELLETRLDGVWPIARDSGRNIGWFVDPQLLKWASWASRLDFP